MINPGIHACVDIESLDTVETGVILSIGIALFNPFDCKVPSTHQFFFLCDADRQLREGRTVSMSTLRFWRQQPNHIWDEATSGNAISVRQLRRELDEISEQVTGCVWAKDPHFDMIMIRNFLGGERSLPTGNLGRFSKWRSVRTIHDAAYLANEDEFTQVLHTLKNDRPHSAIADAVYEARTIQEAVNVIHCTAKDAREADQLKDQVLV